MPATPVDPNAVRAALDSTLEADALPDATVQLDIYAGRASDVVQQWRADLGLTLADNDPIMQRAANLECAALIAPSVPVIVRETVPDYTEQRNPLDRSAQVLDLEGQAYGVLSDAAYVQHGSRTDWVAPFQRAQGTRVMGAAAGTRAEGSYTWPL